MRKRNHVTQKEKGSNWIAGISYGKERGENGETQKAKKEEELQSN